MMNIMRVYAVQSLDEDYSLVTLRAENDGSTVWEMSVSVTKDLVPMRGDIYEVQVPNLKRQTRTNLQLS